MFTFQKDRASFIIYINSDINKHYIVKFDSKLVNWYDSSFEISSNDSLNDSRKTIILPYEYLNKGLYITHWKYGDKIKLKYKSSSLIHGNRCT